MPQYFTIFYGFLKDLFFNTKKVDDFNGEDLSNL